MQGHVNGPGLSGFRLVFLARYGVAQRTCSETRNTPQRSLALHPSGSVSRVGSPWLDDGKPRGNRPLGGRQLERSSPVRSVQPNALTLSAADPVPFPRGQHWLLRCLQARACDLPIGSDMGRLKSSRVVLWFPECTIRQVCSKGIKRKTLCWDSPLLAMKRGPRF